MVFLSIILNVLASNGNIGLARRFILFYMFVENALCSVPNGPHKDRSAVPDAI